MDTKGIYTPWGNLSRVMLHGFVRVPYPRSTVRHSCVENQPVRGPARVNLAENDPCRLCEAHDFSSRQLSRPVLDLEHSIGHVN